MDDQHTDALTDTAIDREIRAALAVEPSPDFLARVRPRIADEPVAPSFRWSWVFAGAAATVIVVAVVASVSRRDLRTADLEVGTTEVGTGAAPTAQAKMGITESRPAGPKVGITEVPRAAIRVSTTDTATTAPAVAPTFRSARAKESPVPEVLISPDTVVAFQQLITSTREGRFQISFDEPLPLAPTPQFTELTISPITIAPLEPIAPDEGVLQ